MKKVLALIAVLSIAMVGATTETTASAKSADPSTSERAGLRATVTPSTPARYQAVTSKLSGARPNTPYYCTLTLWHSGISGGASLAYSPSIIVVNTDRSGRATCRQTFVPFTGTWAGHRHSCPPTRADKRSGWTCGVGYANQNDLNQKTTAKFRF